MTNKKRLTQLVCESYQTDECIAHCNYGSCCTCERIANYLATSGCVVLPWKIGDTVYYITDDYKIETDTVIRLTITATDVNPILDHHNRGFWKHYKGRWFKTLLEAEDYLEELKEWIED
jgi:hypothetical protein